LRWFARRGQAPALKHLDLLTQARDLAGLVDPGSDDGGDSRGDKGFL
jgi:hypothetical protein